MVNLASRPFTNKRPFWLAVGGVLLVSLWIGLYLKAEHEDVLRATADYEKRIKDSQNEFEMRKAEEERRRIEEEKIVLTPQEASELATARLIIPRKAFSVHRLLGDIENFVPEDARMIGIKVNQVSVVAGSTTADIELSAVGKTAAQLTEMLTKLQGSPGLFTNLDASQLQALESGEIPFVINVTYHVARGPSE
jgi:hypothetical protein